jgi:hypothetical protein
MHTLMEIVIIVRFIAVIALAFSIILLSFLTTHYCWEVWSAKRLEKNPIKKTRAREKARHRREKAQQEWADSLITSFKPEGDPDSPFEGPALPEADISQESKDDSPRPRHASPEDDPGQFSDDPDGHRLDWDRDDGLPDGEGFFQGR